MDREEELCDLRETERLTVFIESRTPALPAPLSELEEKALAENVPIIRPMTQNLLLFFMELNAPRSVLEIGTGVGFSALLMESALPEGGRITTIEKDPARAAEAAEHFRSFGAGPDRIRLIQGDAQEAIEALAAEEQESCDLIFLDGAKGQYIRYLPVLLSLLRTGGVLITDNILKGGELLDSRYAVTRRNRTIHRRMLEYLDALCGDPQLRTILLETGDGMAVSVKKNLSEKNEKKTGTSDSRE